MAIINKYKNKKVEFEGIKFDSEMENDFYLYLLKKHKKEDIIMQPSYTLLESFIDKDGKLIKAITYKADFEVLGVSYDVKGMILPVFLLKEKLFKYKYPEKTLKVICKAPKYTGLEWIELSELKKIRKEKKKWKHHKKELI